MDSSFPAGGFAVIDPQGRVIAASEGFAALAGRTSGELAGRSFLHLFDALHQPRIACGMRALAAGRPVDCAATFARDDGGAVHVRFVLERVTEAGRHSTWVQAMQVRGRGRAARPSCAARNLSYDVMLAQETERKRIAADMHDGLGQLLGAAKFGVESALCDLDRGAGSQARLALAETAAIIKRGLEEVRRIAMNLRPSTLDDLGILATLTWFLREFRAIYRGIEVESCFGLEERDVPEGLKLAIFRVVQEAMSNVAKHSRARTARVSLDCCGPRLRLTVEDDGVGFDLLEAASRRGMERRFGHSCARERVESGGGTFEVDSTPGEGTVVTVSWPLGAHAREGEHGESAPHPDRRGPHADALGAARAAGAGCRDRGGR